MSCPCAGNVHAPIVICFMCNQPWIFDVNKYSLKQATYLTYHNVKAYVEFAKKGGKLKPQYDILQILCASFYVMFCFALIYLRAHCCLFQSLKLLLCCYHYY